MEYILLYLLKLVLLIICVLIGVAFTTLFEHKLLGYSQKRKGPVKVGYKGLLQPFSDAVKLLSKELIFPLHVNLTIYIACPIFSLSILLAIWLVFPSMLGMSEITFAMIFMMCCLSASVYPILGAGWSSNSKYSLLGSLRSVAQTISYEVSFFIILLSFISIVGGFNFEWFLAFNSIWFIWISMPLALIWFISSLAETSRTPFDFSEGGSELVSGFNTEYSASPFVLFFMAEYGSIMFMSVLFSLLFLGSDELSLSFYMKICFVITVFLWVRATLPRLRYDKLMNLTWTKFLPISIGYLIFFVGLIMYLNQWVIF